MGAEIARPGAGTAGLSKAELKAVRRRASQRVFTLKDARRRLPENDGGSRQENVLYILEFDSGLIKVGRSASPRKRVETHLNHVNSYTGASLMRGWVSPFHENYEHNERALIAAGRRTADRVQGAEFLFGANFSDLVAYARTLHYLPAVQGPRMRNGLDDFWEPFEGATRKAQQEVERTEQRMREGKLPEQLFNPPDEATLPAFVEKTPARDLLPAIRQIAEIRGIPLLDACLLSWMDLYEMITESRVKAYEARMRCHILQMKRLAIEGNRSDLADPMIAWEELPDEVFGPHLYAVPNGGDE